MEIIVGRNPETRQLNIIKNGTSAAKGKPGSVPMDVSRQHVALENVGDKKWKLRNLNENNVTFVNGLAVESKVVSESDKVELGSSHYVLSWSDLYEPKEEIADIRPLKQVWDTYNQKNIEIRKRQKNIGLLASIPVGFTMLGGLFSSIASEEIRPIAIVFTIIALCVMIYGIYRRATDNSIEEQEEVKRQFQRNYTCPKCGHFMGFQDYELLIQNDVCPYCKTKLKK